MYQKECIICKKQFEAKVPQTITCSKECRKKHQANKSYKCFIKKEQNGEKRICEVCGEEYFSDRKESRFCSMKCTAIGKNYPNKKEKETIKCEWCGKEIEVIKGNPKNRIFCSSRCSGEYRKGKSDDVKRVCLNCGKEYCVDFYKRKGSKFCTRECATYFNMRKMSLEEKEEWKEKISNTQKEQYENGRVHPWIGKKHNEETKQKISQHHIENETFKGENNPMYGKKGELCPIYGIKRSEKTKEKMSELKSSQWLDGKYNGVDFKSMYKRGYYFSIKLKKEIYYRSGWEMKVFEYLDNNEEVIKFINEPFDLVYYDYDRKRRYIPDLLIFYRDGTIKLVEIKPKYLLETKKNLSKFQAAQSFCQEKGYTFEIWTEEDIENLK